MIRKEHIITRERKNINNHGRDLTKHFVSNIFAKDFIYKDSNHTITKIIEIKKYVKSLGLNRAEEKAIFDNIKKYVFNMTRNLAKRLNSKISESKKVDKDIEQKINILLKIFAKHPKLKQKIEESDVLNNRTKIGLKQEIKGFYGNIFYALLPETISSLMDVVFYAKNQSTIIKSQAFREYMQYTDAIKQFLKTGSLNVPNLYNPYFPKKQTKTKDKEKSKKQIFGNPLFLKSKRKISITHETIHLILKEMNIEGFKEEYLVEYLNQLLLLYTNPKIIREKSKGNYKSKSFTYKNLENPYLSAELSVKESWENYLRFLSPEERKKAIEQEIINNILWSM